MRVTEILPAGTWDMSNETDQVLIDYDRRFRRRIVLTTVLGAEVLIDLPQAVRLRDGAATTQTGQAHAGTNEPARQDALRRVPPFLEAP